MGKIQIHFFAVPKTGTHSIESVLNKYSDDFEMSREEKILFLEHIPPVHVMKKYSSEIWNSYFKFAFVRNTWDMVVSDLFWNKLVDRNIEWITVDNVKSLYENEKQYRWGIRWRESESSIPSYQI